MSLQIAIYNAPDNAQFCSGCLRSVLKPNPCSLDSDRPLACITRSKLTFLISSGDASECRPRTLYGSACMPSIVTLHSPSLTSQWSWNLQTKSQPVNEESPENGQEVSCLSGPPCSRNLQQRVETKWLNAAARVRRHDVLLFSFYNGRCTLNEVLGSLIRYGEEAIHLEAECNKIWSGLQIQWGEDANSTPHLLYKYAICLSVSTWHH